MGLKSAHGVIVSAIRYQGSPEAGSSITQILKETVILRIGHHPWKDFSDLDKDIGQRNVALALVRREVVVEVDIANEHIVISFGAVAHLRKTETTRLRGNCRLEQKGIDFTRLGTRLPRRRPKGRRPPGIRQANLITFDAHIGHGQRIHQLIEAPALSLGGGLDELDLHIDELLLVDQRRFVAPPNCPVAFATRPVTMPLTS